MICMDMCGATSQVLASVQGFLNMIILKMSQECCDANMQMYSFSGIVLTCSAVYHKLRVGDCLAMGSRGSIPTKMMMNVVPVR